MKQPTQGTCRKKGFHGRSALYLAVPMAFLAMPLSSLANDTYSPSSEQCDDCDCSESTNGSSGENDISPGSIAGKWRLGVVHPASGAAHRNFAPALSFWYREITPAVFHPNILKLDEPQNAEVIAKPGIALRQIRTVTGMTDIRTLPSPQQGFEIRFFAAKDVPAIKFDGLYVIPPGATPLKTVKIWNPDPPSENPAKVHCHVRSQYSGSVSNKFYSYERVSSTPPDTTHYEYAYRYGSDSNATLWKKVEFECKDIAGEPGECQIYQIESERGSDGSMHVVGRTWKRVAVYKAGEPAVLEERHGVTDSSGGGWLSKTVRTFHTDPTNTFAFGKPASISTRRSSNGETAASPEYIESYSYQEKVTEGFRRTVTTRPWLDNPSGHVTTVQEELSPSGRSYTEVTINNQLVSSMSTSRKEQANGDEIL